MILLEMRNKFLFETNPSLFPEGELTDTEVVLWERYYLDKNENAA